MHVYLKCMCTYGYTAQGVGMKMLGWGENKQTKSAIKLTLKKADLSEFNEMKNEPF